MKKIIAVGIRLILTCIVVYAMIFLINNDTLQKRVLELENKVAELQYKNMQLYKQIESIKNPSQPLTDRCYLEY